jgi:phosphoenolpyruvate-protein phosphotransferase (PTS system enzyme I)
LSSRLHGIPATPGIAIGPFLLYETLSQISHEHIHPDAIPSEQKRLQDAISLSAQEVAALRDSVQAQLGDEQAAIFDAHLLIIEDEELLNMANRSIADEKANAEWAIWSAAEEFIQLLANQDDEYFQARTTDINDIRQRIIAHLQGRSLVQLSSLTHPVIVVARDLLPSDTASLDPRMVLGLLTEQGGPTSHTVILARQLGLPAIVGVSDLLTTIHAAPPDAQIAFNGGTGEVIVSPDDTTRAHYEQALQDYRQQQQALQSLRTADAVTSDGTRVEVAANIGLPKDAPPALAAGANGVGLFRTEFLFLDRSTPPDEEEQFIAYRSVLNTFSAKPVIIRTLDIGGDKTIPYLHLSPESNPFLGLRGIRLCLAEPYQYLFTTQLSALLRAAEDADANLWIMFPMVDDLRELHQARTLLSTTEQQLLANGKLKQPVQERIRVGIMIETPAAALSIDLLAREADFFSIGTNDLTQYTLASDRMNASLKELHRPFHPAVMRAIAQIITSARQQQRWVGMCGEMAGNPLASVFLLGLGINELSMEANSLNAVKQAIRSTTHAHAQHIVQQILAASSAEEIETILQNNLTQ